MWAVNKVQTLFHGGAVVIMMCVAACHQPDPHHRACAVTPDSGVTPCDHLGFPNPPAVEYEGSVYDLAITDLDHDGIVDVVYIDGASAGLIVTLGVGGGRFKPPTVFPLAGTYPRSMAVGDLDHDGKLDVVIANGMSNNVSVLSARGDGTFAAATLYPAGRFPNSVAIGDLNGDGMPDLAVANRDTAPNVVGTVSVLFGTGGGAFGAPVSFIAGDIPDAIAIGDLNVDGKLDLAVSNNGSSTVSVLLGVGNGTFATRVAYGNAGSGGDVKIVDFDGDGKQDLVSGGYLLLGTGAGVFSPPVFLGIGASTSADLDGDGHLDLVGFADGKVTVRLGTGGVMFGAAASYRIAGGGYGRVAVGDLDADGKPDLFIGRDVLLGLGAGKFEAINEQWADGDGLAVADLDNDGNRDLVGLSSFDVNVMLGTGDGSHRPTVRYQAGAAASELVLADVNGDKEIDLVVGTAEYQQGIPPFPSVEIFLGIGGGSFSASPNSVIATESPYGRAMAVGDMNADGKPDLVIADSVANKVYLFHGVGGGTFGEKTTVATADDPIAIAIHDLDGDGEPDLVALNGGQRNTVTVLHNSNGGLTSPAIYDTGPDPTTVAVADLNGDCSPDLVIANSGDKTVSVLLGTGDGTFAPQATYATHFASHSLAIEDLNGDRIPDFVLVNKSAVSVAVLIGIGDGGFARPAIYDVGTDALVRRESVVTGDLDNDGRPDLITNNGVVFNRCLR